jgi:hypothetical protein
VTQRYYKIAVAKTMTLFLAAGVCSCQVNLPTTDGQSELIKIEFTQAALPLEKFFVPVDDVTIAESLTEIQLPQNVDAKAVSVSLDGEALPEEDYGYNPARSKILIYKAINPESQVGLEYKDESALISEFKIPKGAYEVQVTVNHQPTAFYTFNPDSGALIIDPPPPEGAQVQVSYTLSDDATREMTPREDLAGEIKTESPRAPLSKPKI